MIGERGGGGGGSWRLPHQISPSPDACYPTHCPPPSVTWDLQMCLETGQDLEPRVHGLVLCLKQETSKMMWFVHFL